MGKYTGWTKEQVLKEIKLKAEGIGFNLGDSRDFWFRNLEVAADLIGFVMKITFESQTFEKMPVVEVIRLAVEGEPVVMRTKEEALRKIKKILMEQFPEHTLATIAKFLVRRSPLEAIRDIKVNTPSIKGTHGVILMDDLDTPNAN